MCVNQVIPLERPTCLLFHDEFVSLSSHIADGVWDTHPHTRPMASQEEKAEEEGEEEPERLYRPVQDPVENNRGQQTM